MFDIVLRKTRLFMRSSGGLVLLIFLLGLFLRIYRLGANSLWFDEAGVAVAALAPRLADTLAIAQSHVMAMPLDYIVARWMASFSLDEGWLRLPEVIWGALVLPVVYGAACQLIGRKAAFLSMALLAFSAIQVQYSQELRFYAAGMFFYWLSTWLAWRALSGGKLSDWIGFVIATVIGGYYYSLVLFAVLNGFIWLVSLHSERQRDWRLLKAFLISCLVIGMCYFPGYIIFNQPAQVNYGSTWHEAISAVIHGLGFLPNLPGNPDFGWYTGGLALILTLAGAWLAVRRHLGKVLALSVSILLQIGIIIGVDFWKSYFIAPRQFLMFLPLTLILVSLTITVFFDRKEPLLGWFRQSLELDQSRLINRILTVVIIIFIISSSIWQLTEYYAWDKRDGLMVSQVLAANVKPGDRIWVVPWNEPLLYKYYLEKRLGITELSNYFEGKTWDQLVQSRQQVKANTEAELFLITPAHLSEPARVDIRSVGFTPYWGFKPSEGAQLIWIYRTQ